MKLGSAIARRSLGCVIAALAAVAVSNGALAATCNTAGNPPTVSATALNFGNYNAATPAAATSNGTVNVKCVSAVRTLPTFTIKLSQGSAASYAPRHMTSGANNLNYNIYTTAALTTVWGDGTAGTVLQNYAAAALLNLTTFTAFGQIPANQYVKAGAYTDTITVTVTY